MDIRQYISSGVLESYVLGAVNHQEKKEVECLSNIYPEIKEELDHLSETVEGYVIAETAQPSRKVREAIFNDITKIEQQQKLEAKVMAMVNEPETGRSNPFIYWVAAAAVLIIITGFYFFDSKLTERNKELAALNGRLNLLQNEALASAQTKNNLQEQLALLKNPDNQLIALKGTEKHSEAAALICWNKSSKEVFFYPQNMPPHSAGTQYQLWAIVNGQPVDMGVLDSAQFNTSFIKAGIMQQAQAFAITLETKGGSPAPHLDQLYVIGNV